MFSWLVNYIHAIWKNDLDTLSIRYCSILWYTNDKTYKIKYLRKISKTQWLYCLSKFHKKCATTELLKMMWRILLLMWIVIGRYSCIYSNFDSLILTSLSLTHSLFSLQYNFHCKCFMYVWYIKLQHIFYFSSTWVMSWKLLNMTKS